MGEAILSRKNCAIVLLFQPRVKEAVAGRRAKDRQVDPANCSMKTLTVLAESEVGSLNLD